MNQINETIAPVFYALEINLYAIRVMISAALYLCCIRAIVKAQIQSHVYEMNAHTMHNNIMRYI